MPLAFLLTQLHDYFHAWLLYCRASHHERLAADRTVPNSLWVHVRLTWQLEEFESFGFSTDNIVREDLRVRMSCVSHSWAMPSFPYNTDRFLFGPSTTHTSRG